MITITRTNSNNPDFQKLTGELDIELCRIYNTNPEYYEEYNRITNLETVVLAYSNSEVAGCGCFKKFDEVTVELKRMFVVPAYRGKGIASSMVNELEDWAKELGYIAAVLETGNRQTDAISMYRKLGYSETETYVPVNELDISVCMNKSLVD